MALTFVLWVAMVPNRSKFPEVSSHVMGDMHNRGNRALQVYNEGPKSKPPALSPGRKPCLTLSTQSPSSLSVSFSLFPPLSLSLSPSLLSVPFSLHPSTLLSSDLPLTLL